MGPPKREEKSREGSRSSPECSSGAQRSPARRGVEADNLKLQTKFDPRGERFKQGYLNRQQYTLSSFQSQGEKSVGHGFVPPSIHTINKDGKITTSIFNGESANAVHLSAKFSKPIDQALREQVASASHPYRAAKNEPRRIMTSQDSYKTCLTNKKEHESSSTRRLIKKEMPVNNVPQSYKNFQAERLLTPSHLQTAQHSKKTSLVNSQSTTVSRLKGGRNDRRDKHGQPESVHLREGQTLHSNGRKQQARA